MMLFTDGSVNTISKIGFGSYLLLKELDTDLETAKNSIKTKQFTQTSSTKLEIQTLNWALMELQSITAPITVFTDSQNIIQLPKRRERLEFQNFITSKGTLINNHEEYKTFFALIDQLPIELVKIQGHLPTFKKEKLNQFFALVDKRCRIELRQFTK